MVKSLRVTMPDGSKWDVPAVIIARSRAEYYSQKDSEADYQEIFDYTLSDNEVLQDWAENNMNWEDVKTFALLVVPKEVDFQEGWVNGDKEIIEG